MKNDNFLLFHLNIFFSSVEKNKRNYLISNCYWPILNIPKKLDIPVNIEASARTLEEIYKLDKKFIIELKKLIKLKKIYFVESGLNQIIAPITPYEINQQHLKIGKKHYKNLLGKNSNTALINELAYSESLSELYFESGYKNIIMDIDNSIVYPKNNKHIPNCCHSKKGKKKKLNIVWASSFMFQKFQNYVYGDISKDDYINFLQKYNKYKDTIIPLYSGDAEVFNFRPKRFNAERKQTFDEWKRINEILEYLKKNLNLNFKLIPELKNKKRKYSTITSDYQPVIVKKQTKYNITRWALGGRSNQDINTRLLKIFKNEKLFLKKISKKNFYEKLLDLMGSDFRTHITLKRWLNFKRKLHQLEKIIQNKKIYKKKIIYKKNNSINYNKEKTKVIFNNKNLSLILNLRRGMSIENLSFKTHGFVSYIGVSNSENWSNIKQGADFYTGHFMQESLDPFIKITDLEPVNVKKYENEKFILFKTKLKLKFGSLNKTIKISKNSEEIELIQNYKSNKKTIDSIKLNNITFCNIKKKNIKFLMKNGGKKYEEFILKSFFDQTEPPSKFVSANSGLGCTSSELIFFIGKNRFKLSWDNSNCYVLPMLQHKKINNNRLLRTFFSGQEYNETSKINKIKLNFKLRITP